MRIKLEALDRHTEAAYDEFIELLQSEKEAVLACARARHAVGNILYGDGGMYAQDERHLLVEWLQEAADGVNYLARRRQVLFGDGYA